MASKGEWKSTGCILCSTNCGLSVQVEDGHLVRIKGDKANPRSRGYICEKPAGLDHYQNHADRLDTPLRRRPDGSFEAIDWDTAISEIATKLAAIRDSHGGEKIMYYGGGGQGNHLGGAYSSATRQALGMRYASNLGIHDRAAAQQLDDESGSKRRANKAPHRPATIARLLHGAALRTGGNRARSGLYRSSLAPA